MRVLLVKTSALGDIVHAFPVASYIKELFPDAHIEWVVERAGAPLVAAHPSVDLVHTIDSKVWRKNLLSKETWRGICCAIKSLRQAGPYDVIFDLQGNTKSAFILLATRAKHKVGFGRKAVAEWPNLLATTVRYTPETGGNIREDYLFLVKKFFQRSESYQPVEQRLKLTSAQADAYEDVVAKMHSLPGEKILVCPGAAWSNKQLDESHLFQFLQKIAEDKKSSFAFCWGTPAEKALVARLAAGLPQQNSLILDRMELPVLQNAMSHFSCVIAMDSLPLHLAASVGVATFSAFGPSLASKYAPIGGQHIAIQGSCPYQQKFIRRCPLLRSCPTGACLKELTGDQLFSVFDNITH